MIYAQKKSSQYCKNILKGFTLFYSFTSSATASVHTVSQNWSTQQAF